MNNKKFFKFFYLIYVQHAKLSNFNTKLLNNYQKRC